MLKYILIIGVIIAAFALLMPQQFEETTTYIKSFFIKPATMPTYNYNYTQFSNSTFNLSKQQLTDVNNSIQAIPPPAETLYTQNNSIPAPIDPCLLTHLGFPNYAGTEKQGHTCKDVMYNQDDECITNPPINYEGTVNKVTKYSSPQMWCCTMDGSCRW